MKVPLAVSMARGTARAYKALLYNKLYQKKMFFLVTQVYNSLSF